MKQDKIIPQGYKDSPLGIIPKDWEMKRLGKICTFVGGGTPSKKIENFWKGDIPWISSSDLSEDSIYYCNISRYITEQAITSSATKLIPKGSLLIVSRVGIGKVAISPCNLCVSQDFTCCIKSTGDIIYLAYIVKTQMLKKVFQSQGTSIKGITGEEIRNVYIPLPPLPEQKKIAEILSQWDEAIEKQAQIINLLEQRKRGLMQQLLSGKKRLNGFSGEWKKVKMGEIFAERNETNKVDLPLLSITADRGVILQSESDKRDISNNDKSKYKRICSDDIGYNTMRMWQGRSALSAMEGIVSPAYTIITPKKGVNSMFMAILCKQPHVIYDFWTHSQGLVSDTLNCKFPDFCQVKVSIPLLSVEQCAIANVFIEASLEIELAQKRLEEFRTQKRGLMQQLLTGKKRVKI